MGLWLLQCYQVPDVGLVAATRSERREHIAGTQGHGARIPATPAHRLDLLRPEIGMPPLENMRPSFMMWWPQNRSGEGCAASWKVPVSGVPGR